MNETNSLYKSEDYKFLFHDMPTDENTPVFLTPYDLFPVIFIEVIASLSRSNFKRDPLSDILSLQWDWFHPQILLEDNVNIEWNPKLKMPISCK